MPDAGERPSRDGGQIVTFYSFKGGTGRTMALANVAWILAANGKRVLIADWDLESPGLHRFLQPFMDPGVSQNPGIIDFIRRYEWAAVEAGVLFAELAPEDAQGLEAAWAALGAIIDEHVSHMRDYVLPVSWHFPDAGAIDFLSPGKQANSEYQMALSALDWDNFYDKLHGGQFLDALRAHLKRNYDYVLIDSRTGLSDIADICTIHLPDMVVDCFTLSTQGIEGAAHVARQIRKHTEREITILPVPMRIDHSQEDKASAGMQFAERLFTGLPAGLPDAERRLYWAEVQVPYQPTYAYEETLAAFGDRPGSRTSLLSSYERITARITGGAVSTLPPREEWLRLRTRLLFTRTKAANPPEVVLDFSPEDQLWAEWIAAVLASAGIPVLWVGEKSAGPAGSGAPTQVVAVVSESYISRTADSPPPVEPDLLISVTDTRLPQRLAEVPVMFLAGLTETQAMEQLIDRFDGTQPPESESVLAAMRYPGGGRDQIVNMPARNVNFTGRDGDLRELREELRSRRVAVVLPLTIQGLGGVGKTQVAMEYAHRFKADYDIIWWLNCGQPQYIDASLADLGKQMRDVFGASVPEEGGVAEIAEQVLQLLSNPGDQRWLLVYDNAEEIEDIKHLLPSGGGHVLITSREERWADLGKTLKINVFRREESISHLRRRVPAIAEGDAFAVAEVLEDMPLAVAAAGALLASENMPVADYLRRLAEQPVRPLPEDHPLREYPEAVAKAWNLSLDQLQRRSAAAARLLAICSVMAPEISLDLINSQAMADALRSIDPTISERAMIARLIRQIDLFALIKLDNNAHQIQVHRVVQAVVSERLTPAELQSARRDVHQVLVAARPLGDVDDPLMWPAYRQIWPHVTPSLAMLSLDQQVRDLLVERVRYLWRRDDLERGRRRAEEIEGAWKAMLAEAPDPAMARSLRQQLFRLQFNLANILRDLAQFQDSRAVDEAVLRGQQQYLGEEHPHTLQTRSSLAADLRALGDYHAALALDLETYRAWSVTSGYGDEYAGTLMAANNLALSYLLNGDFQSALAHDRQTLERRASVHGPRHPRTLYSGAAVARDLLEAGRYREAARRMEAVLAASREVLGDDDRITLNARLWLGIAQRCTGRAEDAAVHIDAARAGLTRGFGKDSSDALASRLSQALNLMALGRFREGRLAATEVLRVYEGRVGSGHPHSLICRLNIATAFCLEDDYGAAETQIRLAADGLQSRLGSAHPYTLAAKMVQASVLARRSDLADAAALEELVTAERTRVLGPTHPDTLRCRANYLLTLHQRGVTGAVVERQAVIQELAASLGSQHPDVGTAGGGRRLLCSIDPQPF
jgi:MinD-like ATPase involved in chromosome partitioning or flagellar assembly/tetratricopeptide (TPR) repeat protein